MKAQKVSLEELKVESFVTELKAENLAYKGGATGMKCFRWAIGFALGAVGVAMWPDDKVPSSDLTSSREIPASETDFQTDCLGTGIEITCKG